MKLDPLSCDIISKCFFHGDESIPHLAKELGAREHTVRRTLKKLLDSKVIYPNIFLNPQARGVQELQIYLKLVRPGKGTRERFVAALSRAPNVSYLRSVGGQFEFDILICVRTLQEVSHLFEFLSDELEDIEYTKVIAAEMSMTYFAPRLHGSSPSRRESLGWSLADQAYRLDDVDQRVLGALLKYSWISRGDCARHIGLPLSTFEYRVKSLIERRVILAFGYMLNSAAAGLSPHTYLIQVSKSNRDLHKRLFAFCENHPNIGYLVESLGGWDYEIGTRFESVSQGEGFISSLTEELGDSIGSTITLPVFGLVKSLAKKD